MDVRLKPAMVLPVALVALLAAPVAAAPAQSSTSSQPAAASDAVFVKLKIEAGGKTLEHPGHKMKPGEELVLTLKQGKKTHETVVFVEAKDDGYSVEVAYTVDGKAKLKATKRAEAGAWTTFASEDGKSKVSVHLKSGGKRKDGIKIGGGDDPLEGID